MPISALPEHLNSREEIENAFPDDSQFGTTSWWGRLYRWYNKETKTWFAFSYRCTEWWARWRRYPKVLFAIKSKDGYFRIETDIRGGSADCAYDARYLFNESVFHVDNSDPLMISFHFDPQASDVPHYGEPRPELDGKRWFAYWGHFDADLVYWMFTSAYLGRNWK